MLEYFVPALRDIPLLGSNCVAFGVKRTWTEFISTRPSFLVRFVILAKLYRTYNDIAVPSFILTGARRHAGEIRRFACRKIFRIAGRRVMLLQQNLS